MIQVTRKLEAVFQNIERERMQDMPMCNPVLRVEAVNFRQWGQYYFGVMLTPWFMNLMLLPVDSVIKPGMESGALARLAEGSKQMHIFPSGHYEFISGYEAGLGNFLMCSLFSPMFEFGDQQAAVDTANSVLEEMMQADNRGSLSTHQKTIGTLCRDEQGMLTDNNKNVGIPADTENSNMALDEPRLDHEPGLAMSRREFLRVGRKRRGEHYRGD